MRRIITTSICLLFASLAMLIFLCPLSKPNFEEPEKHAASFRGMQFNIRENETTNFLVSRSLVLELSNGDSDLKCLHLYQSAFPLRDDRFVANAIYFVPGLLINGIDITKNTHYGGLNEQLPDVDKFPLMDLYCEIVVPARFSCKIPINALTINQANSIDNPCKLSFKAICSYFDADKHEYMTAESNTLEFDITQQSIDEYRSVRVGK
jgi:hypothetical protein